MKAYELTPGDYFLTSEGEHGIIVNEWAEAPADGLVAYFSLGKDPYRSDRITVPVDTQWMPLDTEVTI